MRHSFFAPLQREVSALCMGSTSFGVDLTGSALHDILDAFVGIGGNFIDTARVYGDFARRIGGLSEKAIGDWMRLRGNRESIIIGTKGGHPPLDDMSAGRLDAKSLANDLRESLDALDTDHVELYWLHRDDTSAPVGAIMDTLNGFIAEGKVCAIGASNWWPERILAANVYAKQHGLHGFSANQPQWSLAKMGTSEDPTLRTMDAEMYRMHLDTHLAAIPFSSQAKGFFIKLFEGGEAALSPKARNRFLTPHNMAIYDELVKIHEESGTSVGALSLAYLTCQPFPVFPIVGVSNLKQASALREAGDAVISEKAMHALMQLTGLL